MNQRVVLSELEEQLNRCGSEESFLNISYINELLEIFRRETDNRADSDTQGATQHYKRLSDFEKNAKSIIQTVQKKLDHYVTTYVTQYKNNTANAIDNLKKSINKTKSILEKHFKVVIVEHNKLVKALTYFTQAPVYQSEVKKYLEELNSLFTRLQLSYSATVLKFIVLDSSKWSIEEVEEEPIDQVVESEKMAFDHKAAVAILDKYDGNPSSLKNFTTSLNYLKKPMTINR